MRATAPLQDQLSAILPRPFLTCRAEASEGGRGEGRGEWSVFDRWFIGCLNLLLHMHCEHESARILDRDCRTILPLPRGSGRGAGVGGLRTASRIPTRLRFMGSLDVF